MRVVASSRKWGRRNLGSPAIPTAPCTQQTRQSKHSRDHSTFLLARGIGATRHAHRKARVDLQHRRANEHHITRLFGWVFLVPRQVNQCGIALPRTNLFISPREERERSVCRWLNAVVDLVRVHCPHLFCKVSCHADCAAATATRVHAVNGHVVCVGHEVGRERGCVRRQNQKDKNGPATLHKFDSCHVVGIHISARADELHECGVHLVLQSIEEQRVTEPLVQARGLIDGDLWRLNHDDKKDDARPRVSCKGLEHEAELGVEVVIGYRLGHHQLKVGEPHWLCEGRHAEAVGSHPSDTRAHVNYAISGVGDTCGPRALMQCAIAARHELPGELEAACPCQVLPKGHCVPSVIVGHRCREVIVDANEWHAIGACVVMHRNVRHWERRTQNSIRPLITVEIAVFFQRVGSPPHVRYE
eukprot:7380165-Prymnesium_polylepis.1